MIYLDNSATTQMDEDVLTAMLPWLRQDYGNASSIYGLGRRARVAIEQARVGVCRVYQCPSGRNIFHKRRHRIEQYRAEKLHR